MVRKLLSAGALFCLPLLLGSCGGALALFLASTFPMDASYVSAQRDFSATFPPTDSDEVALSVVSVNGTDYVILSSRLRTAKVSLFVMDADLNITQSLTIKDLDGFGGSISKFPARLDAAGRIVLGNMHFQTGPTGLQVPPAVSWIPDGDGFAAGSGGGTTYNLINFSASGNALSYEVYDSNWGSPDHRSGFVIKEPATVTPQTSFKVQAVFSDPERKDSMIVLHDEGDKSDHFIRIPWADMVAGPTTPILDVYEAFSKPGSDRSLMGYVQGGIIRFLADRPDAESGLFVRCDSAGTDQQGQLWYSHYKNLLPAYRTSGGFYYIYDRETRIVTRVSAWW